MESSKGSEVSLEALDFLWLRGPATTCRRTGR